MAHRCEAIEFCRGGDQCPNYHTEQIAGSGRWLCWVHRVSFLKPEPREHAPLQFVPQRAPV